MLIPVRTSLTDREKERHLSDSCLSAIGKTAASKHTNYIMTVRTLARKLGHYSFHYYKTTSPLLPAAPAYCHPHSIIIYRVARNKKKKVSPQIQFAWKIQRFLIKVEIKGLSCVGASCHPHTL